MNDGAGRPGPGDSPINMPLGIGRDVIKCSKCGLQFRVVKNLPIQICPSCNEPHRLQTATYER